MYKFATWFNNSIRLTSGMCELFSHAAKHAVKGIEPTLCGRTVSLTEPKMPPEFTSTWTKNFKIFSNRN